DAIHFGILAYDREPGSIRATHADRDAISGEDHVVIYLDTFTDRRRAYVFAVNPLAVQQDGVRTGGAGSADRMFGGGTDPSPDFLFESKGRITPEGYVVEVRIPFKSLRSSNAAEQTSGPQHRADHPRAGRLRVRAHADPTTRGRDPADARVLLPRRCRAARGTAGRARGRAHRGAAERGRRARGPRRARRAARGPARVVRAGARHRRVRRLRRLAGAQSAARAGGTT